MGGSNGGSSSDGMRPRFPLVVCDSCNVRRVKHYVSKTDDNYLRHFYKCPNHGTHRGGCNFWKWEDVYEEYLEKLGLICQNQTEDSSSLNLLSARSNSRLPMKKMINGGRIENHRELKEIVVLLKVIICCLFVLVCFMIRVVCKL